MSAVTPNYREVGMIYLGSDGRLWDDLPPTAPQGGADAQVDYWGSRDGRSVVVSYGPSIGHRLAGGQNGLGCDNRYVLEAFRRLACLP